MINKKLNNMEFATLCYFLIRASFVGITFNYLIRTVKQDAWIVPIIGLIVGFILICVISYIFSFKSDLTIIEKIMVLFKKKLGILICIIIIIIATIYNVFNTINLNSFIHIHFLNKTPTTIIIIAFILSTFYVLTKGINAISKTNVIILYINVIMIFITIIGLFFKFRISNLKPLFIFNSKNITSGIMFYSVFNTFPILFLSIIPKDKIKNVKIFKSLIISYIAASITIFFAALLTIGVSGYEIAYLYKFPEFQVLKQISLIGISSRIESILAIQWLFDLFIFNAFFIYFICNSLKKIINTKFSINYIYMFYCIFLIIVLKCILKFNIYIEYFMYNYSFKYLFVTIVAIVLLICIKIKLYKK